MLVEVTLMIVLAYCLIAIGYIAGCILEMNGLIPKPERLLFRSFNRTVFGILILIILWSILQSQGQTVFVIGLIVVLGYYFFFKSAKTTKINSKEYFMESIQLLWLAFLFPIIFGLQLLYGGADHLEPDLLYYAKISEFLHISGENKFHGYIDRNPSFKGLVPYHYFELWLVNGLSRVSGITSAVLLQYFAYPLFKSILVFGISSSVLSALDKPFKIVGVILGIVFMTFIPIGLFLNFLPVGWHGYGNVWLRPNLIFYAVYLMPSFVLLNERRYPEALVVSLFIPIISITTAPSYFLCYGLMSLFLFWSLRSTIFLRIFLFGVCVGCGIALLYAIKGTDATLFVHPPWNEMIASQVGMLKATLGVTAGLIIQVLVVGLGMYLLNFFLPNALGSQIGISILLSVIGIILFQSFPLIDNTYQFPYFGYTAMNLVLLLILSRYFLVNRFRMALVLGLLLFVLPKFLVIRNDAVDCLKSDSLGNYALCLTGYDVRGVKKITELLDHESNLAFTLDRNALSNDFPGKRRHFLTMQLGGELSYLFNRLRFYPIVPSEFLYHFPEGLAAYEKPRGFNQVLDIYQEYFSADSNATGYLANHQVKFLLRNQLTRNEYEPIYPTLGSAIRLKPELYIISLPVWK